MWRPLFPTCGAPMSDNAQTALVLTLLALIAFGAVLSLGF
jgi:hypothetical protein